MLNFKEVRVLCKEEDHFFFVGFILLIKSVFRPETTVTISDDFSAISVMQADIILMTSCSLLLNLCHPNFRFRKQNSIVIGVTQRNGGIKRHSLPLCYSDIIFINRNEKVSVVRSVLENNIVFRPVIHKFSFTPGNCFSCNRCFLSYNQLRVVKYLRAGYSINKIAEVLCVSTKTAYDHKYRIMQKLGARGNAELNELINSVSLYELSRGECINS